VQPGGGRLVAGEHGIHEALPQLGPWVAEPELR
jgi:hypothetical protein